MYLNFFLSINRMTRRSPMRSKKKKEKEERIKWTHLFIAFQGGKDLTLKIQVDATRQSCMIVSLCLLSF